ncbi:nucleotidyltransferase AbiEii toxin of type IV toxin-antitoxin system [Lacibacter cauensis]|uniref:Nucleotidyltransferase AbiEii toxin of type IV toxin-antitoxin system n=1 Tax=Lacibacter cauensis TaxID=510947 RepID=A0A562S9E7_9BACT|nr:nucleotidyl transferase AbiEii/AbiGii toxin family protein [Lacibacter cauensis]TWI77959.1 nucleotidyltransferase AbiEii toxin of type IV toxin-antitoxin system [Lacibacter cauensis]
MTGWLKLTDDQRRETLDQVQRVTGINVKAIEKDWWVTLVLKALFQTAMAGHFMFKGGTSLSKGWKLIPRFSEDIDIALHPNAFGRDYVNNPTHSYVKQLKREGCAYTSTAIKDALQQSFLSLGVPAGILEIIVEEVKQNIPDKDPQTLYVHYPSLYQPNPYLADAVKIEFSVRSLAEPFEIIQIQSLLNEYFPNRAYAETPFLVRTVVPRKTFIEKVLLLHEKFANPALSKLQGDRMSRHLYDLIVMMKTAVLQDALNDRELFKNLLQHRAGYIRVIDYKGLTVEGLTFIPSPDLIELYRRDYEFMQANMIYSESPDFSDLIKELKWLNGKFRVANEHLSLEQLAEQGSHQLKDGWEHHPNDTVLQTRIVKVVDPYLPSSPANKAVNYIVSFVKTNGQLVFEDIVIENKT